MFYRLPNNFFYIVWGCVAIDIFLSYQGWSVLRGIIPACILYLAHSKFNLSLGWFGLGYQITYGWLYWLFVSLLAGIILFCCHIIMFYWRGDFFIQENCMILFIEIIHHKQFHYPHQVWIYSLFIAPIHEEILYRYLLENIVIKQWGLIWAILVSGTLFALLHWTVGNLSFSNLLGGYLLAILFGYSRNIWLTICWHSVGNLFILLFW